VLCVGLKPHSQAGLLAVPLSSPSFQVNHWICLDLSFLIYKMGVIVNTTRAIMKSEQLQVVSSKK
jgi:hypothetical protein